MSVDETYVELKNQTHLPLSTLCPRLAISQVKLNFGWVGGADDGRARQTASLVFTVIMSGRVRI